jgi:hypothetical protein
VRRLLAVLLLAATAACGNGARELTAPARVSDELAPKILGDGITVSEYAPARQRFARAGASSLVADGRVWAIRKGQTLVGTLQASTVKNDVDLTKATDRKQVIDGVMTGSRYDTIYVGHLKVLSSSAADHTLYLWFGDDLFEVLQVKAGKVAPDDIAGDILEYQISSGLLR